jgi:hypothetical protein
MFDDTLFLGFAAFLFVLIFFPREPSDVEATVDLLRRRGIKCCVFDMDQCLVAAHSRGSLRRQDLDQFIQAVTPSFQLLVPALKAAGIKLAVATHSDGIEHTSKKPRSTHIIGKELAHAVLLGAVPQHATSFFVVAFNQKHRAKTQYCASDHGAVAFLDSSAHPPALVSEHNKRFHMHTIAAHFGLSTSEMVLYDDDAQNISETGGAFLAVQVDEKLGFQLGDAIMAGVPEGASF